MMAGVVAGAPEALEACQVICTTVTATESSTAASSVSHHHSHHQEAVPSGRPALQAVPNACGPGDALLPSAAHQSARVTGQPVIAASGRALPIISKSAPPHAQHLHQKPPGSVLFAAPLRV
jgi:hypothetical protein